MKKVLFIAYALPPTGGGGVQRPAKFIKYLRNYGWEPVCLTVLNPSVPVFDKSLARDIPEDIKIYKARTFEPSYASKASFGKNTRGFSIVGRLKGFIKNILTALLVPDIQVLWWPGLIYMMIKVFRKETINCVFVTAPPFSSLVIVTFISRIFGIPAVVDFRDEWFFVRANLENVHKNKIVNKIDSILERYVVSNCSAFIGVTQKYVEGILERHPNINKDKGFVIRNGYDADDFKDVARNEDDRYDRDIVTIVYTGTVWRATSLESFTLAIERLFSKQPELKNKVFIKISGRVVDTEKKYLISPELKNNVELFGYRSHKDIIKEIMGADILLLTLSNLDGAERLIPAKVYEYMATGNHILAIIPDGEAKEILINNYTNLTVVNPGDIIRIEYEILSIIQNKKTNKSQTPETISQFERSQLTYKLTKIFETFI